MLHNDFYTDRKWCSDCVEYVPYLRSDTASYCAHCGRATRLFSDADRQRFQAEVRAMPRPFRLLDPADQDRA